jgi:hypothetical protein
LKEMHKRWSETVIYRKALKPLLNKNK